MTKVEAEKGASREGPETASRKKIILAVVSWVPAVCAAAIASYFIFSIQQNHVALARLDERLLAAKAELQNVESQRAQTLLRSTAQIAEAEQKLRDVQDAIAAARVPAPLVREVNAIVTGSADRTKAADFWKMGKKAEQQGHMDEARREYENSIGADDRYIRAYLSLGKLYENRKNAGDADLGAAADWYQKAAQQSPYDADVFENLALVEIRRRDWRGLVQACLNLKSLRPNSEALGSIMGALESRDGRLACDAEHLPFAQYLSGLDAENRGALAEAFDLYSSACKDGEKRACFMRDKVAKKRAAVP